MMSDIDLNVGVEGFLIVIPSNKFSRFLDAKVAC